MRPLGVKEILATLDPKQGPDVIDVLMTVGDAEELAAELLRQSRQVLRHEDFRGAPRVVRFRLHGKLEE